jgi:hypothetical protein
MTPRVAAMPPWAHWGWRGRPGRRPTMWRVLRRARAWSPQAPAQRSLGFPRPLGTTGWPVTPRPPAPLGSPALTAMPHPRARRSGRSRILTLRTRALCRSALAQGPRRPSARPPGVRARARLAPTMPCAWGGWCPRGGAPGPRPPSSAAALGLAPPPQASPGSPPPAGPLVSVAWLARPSGGAKRCPPSRRRGRSLPSGARAPAPMARRLPPVAGLLTRAPRPPTLGHPRSVWSSRPRAGGPGSTHAGS